MERFDLIGLQQTGALAQSLPGDSRIYQEAHALAGTKTFQIPDRAFTVGGRILRYQRSSTA
jgi:hypothetical protein